MTKIKVKALDTLHVSSVGPDNILAGETFEVSKHIAADLEKRGLVTIEDAELPPVIPPDGNSAAGSNASLPGVDDLAALAGADADSASVQAEEPKAEPAISDKAEPAPKNKAAKAPADKGA